MKRLGLLVFLILFTVPLTFSQAGSLFSVDIVPYGTIPLGSSTDLFKPGYGLEASVSLIPGSLKYLGLGIHGNFVNLPLEIKDSMWALTGFAGPVLRIPLGKKLALHANASVGYYYYDSIGWDSPVSGSDLALSGGAGFTFLLTDLFSIGLGASYDYYFNFYNGFSFNLSTRLNFPFQRTRRPAEVSEPERTDPEPELLDETGSGVEIRDIELLALFPVLYKYYDSNSVGTLRIKNFEQTTAEGIQIKLYVERYMDNPMKIGETFSLEPGEEKTIELFGLFTEDMMEITEGTKASARIDIVYSINDTEQTADYTPILEFYNRNALTWDDDRKIASFITAKDPQILRFAKNVTTWIQDVKNPAVDENLQKAMAIFDAVKTYGIQYEVDPTTPFSEFSMQKTVIDFLQFPSQTLKFTNGDCDDLTALYTSLLEAVGIETAIITIPGHIYAAFALKSTPEEVRKAFSRSDEFLFIENRAWVPVEITLFQDSFEKAWQTGAKEWRENLTREQSLFYPTRDSWSIFQPVGFHDDNSEIRLPDKEVVTAEFEKTMIRHVEREIYPQEIQIRIKMEQSDKKYRFENQLAVLYARYGLYERAEEIFLKIIEEQTFKPALINLGNVFFIKGDFDSALSYYQQVIDLDSQNTKALLGVSRCNHELENYGLVNRTYTQLKVLDPVLAHRYAYLDLRGDEAGRAAEATGLRNTVLWEDEK